MQPAETAFFNVLDAGIVPGPGPRTRDLTALFEFYEYDTLPGPDGFDPAEAVARFAKIEYTWLGHAYRRIVFSAADITKAKGSQANRCTLRLSNADENRFAANWITTNQVEGMRLVVRLISRSASTTLAASNQRFSGRCDVPEGFDVIQGSVAATEDVGGDDVEFPPRVYLADDPEGRSPADPLNEGFPLVVLQGTFRYRRLEPDKSFERWDARRYYGTLPYSSYDDTPLGDAIPMVLGRTQMRLVRGIFVDEGFVTKCLDFACMGPIAGFLNFRMEAPPSGPVYFTQPESITYHLGEAGGTGTQTHDPLWPNHPLFSYTAYIGYLFRGIFPGAATTVNAGEATVATVLGLTMPLPDSSGVFDTTDWSDNGAYQTRLLLTGARFFNHDPAFVEDSAVWATGLYNDEPLVDQSNSGQILIPDPEAAAAGVLFQRFRSTSLINAARARHALGLSPDMPESLAVDNGDFTPFDPFDPPLLSVDVTRLCKRFTTNVLLKKRVRAKDFLFKTLLPSFRGYLVINHRGKWEPRSERPADFAHLRAASLAGATQILVEDVTAWKAANGLWGQALLQAPPVPGSGSVTSEVRKVTAADYTVDADAIMLAASKTGAVTVLASGATLSGGSSSARATGTVTIGGSPAAGDTVTVTIQGVGVTYTVESSETAATVAYMAAAHINANTQLRRFVSASASGAVVTVASKWGVLTLSSALANPHGGPVSNPTAAPSVSASGSGSSLLAGTYRVAYANRNANGSTYVSPYSAVTVAAGQNIAVAALALPAGVTSRDWFVSKGANDPEMVLYANRDGAGFDVTAPPSSTANFSPEYNTTGEECVRVALSFASNNQTPEILAQANLTRGNIFADTYKWPGGRDQSSFTEAVGTYVSAKDDFAESKVIVVNDAKRARLGKKSPKELDLTAVDNYHQARRLVYFDSAKFIDHHWFNQLKSNGLALLLEEGDVICASDDSGGHVNVLTQVEEFTIHLSDFTVSINRARLYSTDMFRELVPRTRPLLPSVLRWTQTLDTEFQILDLPVWKEEERGRSLIRIPIRPEDGTGDWRGATVWMDRGDGNGYRQIGEHDVTATMGELDTDMPAASPHVFSTATVRVRVEGDKTLTSRSEEEVRKGANLARAKGVLFRFKEANFVTQSGTARFYDLTGLLIGLYGTEQETAVTGDEFTLLDGSELVLDFPVELLGKPVDIKVLTVNRDLADTAAQSFTFAGKSLKHPAPVLNQGMRNHLGDLLATWRTTGQGVGNLRPGLVNPLTEERELYRFRVMSDDGLTEHYRFDIEPGLSYAPAFWKTVKEMNPGDVSQLADGGVMLNNSGSAGFAHGIVESFQEFTGEVRVTFRIPSGFFTDIPSIGLMPVGRDAETGAMDYGFDALTVGASLVVEGDASTEQTYVAGDEFTVWMKNGVVTYYKSFKGEDSVPFYTSAVAPAAVAYKLVARPGVGASILESYVAHGVRILRREPEALVTAAMQTQKFGSLKSPLRVKVNRVSSLVGEGHDGEGFI